MRITLPSGTPAELAISGGAKTGLVIVPDNFGLRPLFDEMCSRLAADNNLAVCAVELWPGNEHLDKDEKWKLVPSVDESAVISDLQDAADATGCEKVHLMGFCMGGMYAFRAAGTSERFDRIVSFYGLLRLPKEALSPTQSEPIETLRATTKPVLAIMGGHDPWCPQEDIDELKETVPSVKVIEYPQAGHAFAHDPQREEYRPDDAGDAWQKAIEFLEVQSK